MATKYPPPGPTPPDDRQRQTQSEPVTDRQLDAVLDALAVSHRRAILRYLVSRSRPTAVADVVRELSRLERFADAGPVTATREEAIEARLYHVDLPKLIETGLVEHESDRDTVQLGEMAARSWARAIIREGSAGE